MSKQDVQSNLPEEARREVFRALVEEQDRAVSSVLQSRADIARRFDITVAEVREIEREGIEQGWPPL
jgi:hypothetical protein